MGFVISSNPSPCRFNPSTLDPLPNPSVYIETNTEFLQENNLTIFRFPDRFLAEVLREVKHGELACLIRSFEDATRSILPFNVEHEVDRVVYRARILAASTRKQWKEMIQFLNDNASIHDDDDSETLLSEMKRRIRMKANSL